MQATDILTVATSGMLVLLLILTITITFLSYYTFKRMKKNGRSSQENSGLRVFFFTNQR